MTDRVVVVDYDEDWPHRFEQLRARIWTALANEAVSVEHVGSTAVAGLAAKPIIDMTVVVRARANVALAVERLATLGYRHQGNLGIDDREAFDQAGDLPRHHLYVAPEGTLGIVNHLAVRDYLRLHPKAARQYGDLKKRLAAQFADDIDRYTLGKTAFLIEVLRRAGLADDQLASIACMNRMPRRL
jgi:GrpB-like predicted nucleotidyltransferase (UPF0157 family)